MGYICHHTIVVCSWGDHINEAHDKAVDLFGELVSPIINGLTNGYQSFFVAPDGSKEGWNTSDEMNDNRNEFVIYLKSTYCDWFEIQFGDENGHQYIVRHSG